MAHVGDHLGHVVLAHQIDALLEDHPALIVRDVVVFQKVFTDVEVARLDLLLRFFQRLVDPGMDDRLAFLKAELGEHAAELVRSEDAHQVVFERQIEFRAAGIALTAGTAAQLVVDAAAFVAFGADDIEAAGCERFFLQCRDIVANFLFGLLALGAGFHVAKLGLDPQVGIAAELNVGAAAGHIGCDRDRARNAGLRDDLRFLLVVARVQNREYFFPRCLLIAVIESPERIGVGKIGLLVALLLQCGRQLFRLLNRGRADQDRLAARLAILNRLDDRFIFLFRGPIDFVVLVGAVDRKVGRDFDHFELVDVHEFVGLGRGRAGHARKLAV